MKFIKTISIFTLIIAVSCVLWLYMLVDYHEEKLPNIDNLDKKHSFLKKKIYSESGRLLKSNIQPEKYVITDKQISQNILKIFDNITVDNSWFYGIIAGNVAGKKNNLDAPIYRLASDLLPEKKDIIRVRVKQTILINQLKERYSREELVARYLNKLKFDDDITGLMHASYEYFGVTANQLNINQLALLKAISLAYNSDDNIKISVIRKTILRDIRNKNLISKKTYKHNRCKYLHCLFLKYTQKHKHAQYSNT